MKSHKSQYVWFRKLYMIFSRYTLINTLQEVNMLDLELDLQFEDDDDWICTDLLNISDCKYLKWIIYLLNNQRNKDLQALIFYILKDQL